MQLGKIKKHINKGSDQATFSLQSTQEVQKFQSGHYMSSSEFNIVEPAITHLVVF